MTSLNLNLLQFLCISLWVPGWKQERNSIVALEEQGLLVVVEGYTVGG